MVEARRCTRCCSTIPADALDGLCPACVMLGVLGESPGGASPWSGNEPPTTPHGPLAETPPDATPVRDGVTDATTAPEPAEDAPSEGPGVQVGPYTLREQIGQGGMGSVYLAEQSEPVRRVVALKITRVGMDGRHVIARFQAERQALAMMDHPNIARVLDAGETEDARPYFAMELVRGEPISAYCDNHRLTIRRRLELFVPVCKAVQHAHQKGIIHRDLKPSNILVAEVDGRPQPKVIDFGIAKAIDEPLTGATLATQVGQVVGTVEYMSPEQASLDRLDIDTRSDVYALGVVLYELLAGQTPFDHDRFRSATLLERLRVIREDAPTRPSVRLRTSPEVASLASRLSTEPGRLAVQLGELDWIVMKALEKDRDRRYQTTNGLAVEIERYLNDEPIAARPPSAGYRLRTFARRNRSALAAVSTILLALVVGLIGTAWQAVRATRAERDALDAQQLAQSRFEAEQRARLRAQQAEAAAEREADRARTEAAIARAVNDFINEDLLVQASPGIEPDREIKLRTVLDRAAENVWTRFQGQPLVEAALHRTLGTTYRSLGEYEEAERHCRRTLELHRRELGDDDRETLADLAELATILYRLHRFPESEGVSRAALDRCHRALPPGDPLTLLIWNRLALSLHRQDRGGEAEKHYHDILELHERASGHENTFAALLMQNRAVALDGLGRLAESEVLHRQSLAILRRVMGPEHPETVNGMYWFARLLMNKGLHAEAVGLREQVYRTRKDLLGPEHPLTLESMFGYAISLAEVGRLSESLDLHGRAYDAQRRILGLGHPDTIRSLRSVHSPRIYRELGRYDECMDRLAQLVRTESDEPPFFRARGEILAKFGQWEEASQDWILAPNIDAERVSVFDAHGFTALLLTLGKQAEHREYTRILDRRFRESHPNAVLFFQMRNERPSLDGEQFLELAEVASAKDDGVFSLGMTSTAYYFAGQYERARDLMNLPGWYGGDVAYWLARIHDKLGDGTAHRRLREAEEDYHRLTLHCLTEPRGAAAWSTGHWGMVAWTRSARRVTWRLIYGHDPPDDPLQQGIDAILMRPEKVDATYGGLVDAHPSDPVPYFQRWAAAHVGWKRWDEAGAVLDRFIEHCPDHHAAWLSRAALFLMAGDEEGYGRFCSSLLDDHADTRDPDVARMLVRCCGLAPHAVAGSDRLVDLAGRACRELPEDGETPDALAIALFLGGDHDAAIDRLDRVVAVRPEGATIRDWLLRALIHERSGDETRAQDALAGYEARLADESQFVAFAWSEDWAEDFELNRMRLAAEGARDVQ